MNTVTSIIKQALPVIGMVTLIPFITNDYILTFVYIAIITIAFLVRRDKNDLLIFFFGLITMTISETFFLATRVETFQRVSLFGIMPLWLPFLWAYGFVAIKRGIHILDR